MPKVKKHALSAVEGTKDSLFGVGIGIAVGIRNRNRS
jgi:hypothetical protein